MQLVYEENERYERTDNNLIACVDWLSFTIKPNVNLDVEELIFFLGFHPADFIMLQRGSHGYRSTAILSGDNIRISYNGATESMGIHVDVSGSAMYALLSSWYKSKLCKTPFETCAVATQDLNYTILLDLLDALSEIASFTRIDLAIDDIECNYYSCDDIIRLIENKQLICKFRKYDVRSPRYLTGELEGQTIYLGKRTSDVMLRIYDKQLELQNKHNKECPYPWIRWELELKHDRANEAVRLLLETQSLSTVCLGILKQYVRFIIPDNKTKNKCSTAPTWELFLGDVKKLSLYVPNNPKTLEDTKNWIKKYVGPSISAVLEADGGSMEFIYDNALKWKAKRERNPDLTNRLKREMQKSENL